MARRIRTRRIPRRRGALTGLLLVLLGAWGAVAPFVGPYFDFQIGTTDTWDWSMDRLWLSVLPGAVTVLGGLILLGTVKRNSARLGALIALTGGLWFVVGPSVSMLWNDGDPATGAAIGDTGTRVLEWIGFFYGTGALITLLSAYQLGFLAALPIIEEAIAPAEAAPRAAEPAATASAPAGTSASAANAEPVTTNETTTPREPAPAPRRRGLLRRRRSRDDIVARR